MSVQFTDNRVKVKAALDNASKAYLYEVGVTLQRQAARNTTIGHETASKWDYKVDESKGECVIGNPSEMAIWDELGTGEFALNKDGRKGYWVYVKGSTGSTSTNQKSYTLKEAKQIVAMMRAEGLEAFYTNGRKPRRGFFNAFTTLKPAIIRRAEEVLKARME